MEIIYGKNLTDTEKILCQQISASCGIMYDTARLLLYRNIDTVEKAKAFLSPGKKGFNNPYLLDDMQRAVDRITLAKNRNQNVLIFGDYDADGICATTILYFVLKDFGITATTVIPERDEGYGLNVENILKLNEQNKVDLVITVDCGISDGEKIKVLIENGIDVIVTDHHEPPEVLPDCIRINPKINGQLYPFSGLCGAGVAYKLGSALIGDKADDYLDFTALATVADSMELVGENRDIVVEGLKIFNGKNLKPQFKNLLGEGNRVVTSQTLAYTIAPRINAGGRMGDANLALKLFLSDNVNDIFDYSAKLGEYNMARQVECDNIYREAKAMITEQGLENDSVILVASDEWKTGFIGIVAAKLVEDYSRPVIVFAGHDGHLKGSARSVEQVNIYDAICSVGHLLLVYGGHSQAAGISVAKENLPLLRQELLAYVKNNTQEFDFDKKIYAEWNVTGAIPIRFAREIELLEPFGVGNKRPLFTTQVGSVQSLPLKSGSMHYSFKTDTLEMLDFNGGGNVLTLSMPINKKVLFEINLSVFRGKESLKGYSRQVIAEYGDFSKVEPYVFANELEKIIYEKENKLLKAENVKNHIKLGTVFALSNFDNLTKYKELDKLPVYLFVPEEKKCSPCVVLSLKNLPNGYDTIVYLDRPLAYANLHAKQYIIDINSEDKYIKNLSVEREYFASDFAYFKSLVGKQFNGVADFCLKNADLNDLYQKIFALTVFMELKIFVVENGVLSYDATVKNSLTNSKVYSKICLNK